MEQRGICQEERTLKRNEYKGLQVTVVERISVKIIVEKTIKEVLALRTIL
jgi:hypothetical protein